MPNWVCNFVIMRSKNEEDYKRVLDFIKSNESAVDFNNIIKMPDSLNVVSGTIERYAIAVYKYKFMNDNSDLMEILKYACDWEENINTCDDLYNYLLDKYDNLLKLGKTYVNNINLYGYSTWYDWRINNWGTKWNAVRSWEDGDKFGFETAWSSVTKLMILLSTKFPNVLFCYGYADECLGVNVNRLHIQNGNVQLFNELTYNDDYEIANKFWDYHNAHLEKYNKRIANKKECY